MKKNKILAIVLSALLLVSVGAAVSACQTEEVYGMNYSYVSVSINPKVDFVVDENNIVTDVIPMNEDAEILLADKIEQFIGLTADEAVELFTQMAVEAGYIDVESELSEVEIEVISDKGEETASQIAEKIRSRVNSYFANNGIFGRVNVGSMEEYLEQAEALGLDIETLSVAKIKAVLTAFSLMPELDPNELAEMSVGEIIKLIHEETNHGKMKLQNTEFKREKQQLFEEEYGDITALRAQIETIETQIETMEDGEEKTALIAQLEELQTRLNDMVQSYKAETEQLREQRKEQAQTVKNEKEQIREQKVEEHKDKLEERQQRIGKDMDKTREEIENMQKNQKGNGKN